MSISFFMFNLIYSSTLMSLDIDTYQLLTNIENLKNINLKIMQ
ncbi:hypothetical protein H1P_1410018 [Hyella patelloides LEGE 07179]|uniref:Uncharacterized protein n=1 Tax=Hyella patelloides LEGE 07179 TaxID=945734 RepID=A0A563VLU2_9CYAN|nr:hypothetical protein H1P_1410018 [Hyella patelloides LEGE 07179]